VYVTYVARWAGPHPRSESDASPGAIDQVDDGSVEHACDWRPKAVDLLRYFSHIHHAIPGSLSCRPSLLRSIPVSHVDCLAVAVMVGQFTFKPDITRQR